MTNATIIPFPQRNPVSAESDRLAKALESLQAALEEQRRALSDWRYAMTELGIGVAGLGHSLAGYQDSLIQVDEKLGLLRTQSAQLEAWADGVLSQATP
jgi:hypothetical protein